MQALLRSLALGAAFGVTLLSSSHAALPFGSCRTLCSSGGAPFTPVVTTTSQSTCCSNSFNPCPPGTTKVGSTYSPAGGTPLFCGPRSGG